LTTHRWLQPIVDQLRQGISPQKIALTIALGIVLGITPALGTTVVLCTVAAIVFRLNLPVIQLVNGLVYPLQLILLIPFYRMGAWMFGADVSTISLHGVVTLIRSGMWQAIRTLWVVTLHALAAWLLLGAAASGILYIVLIPVMRRIWTKIQAPAKPAHL
jgi:uncharacterized protein (DUF2062 family)